RRASGGRGVIARREKYPAGSLGSVLVLGSEAFTFNDERKHVRFVLGDEVDEAALLASVGPGMFLRADAPAVFVAGTLDLLADADLEGKPGLIQGSQEFFRE